MILNIRNPKQLLIFDPKPAPTGEALHFLKVLKQHTPHTPSERLQLHDSKSEPPQSSSDMQRVLDLLHQEETSEEETVSDPVWKLTHDQSPKASDLSRFLQSAADHNTENLFEKIRQNNSAVTIPHELKRRVPVSLLPPPLTLDTVPVHRLRDTLPQKPKILRRPLEAPTSTPEREAQAHHPDLWGVASRQIAAPLMNSLLSIVSNRASYQFTYASYAENPFNPMFRQDHLFAQTRLKDIYNPLTPLGQSTGRWLLPPDLRHPGLSAEETAHLRRNGARLMALSGYGLSLSQGLRVVGNVGALITGQGDRTALATETLSLATNFTDGFLYNLGAQAVAAGNASRAVSILRASQSVNIIGSLMMVASGATRIAAELHGAGHGQQPRPSAMFYGALDIGNGASGAVYSGNLLRLSATTENILEKGNALLGYVAPAPLLRMAMRGLGMIGAGMGVITNIRQMMEVWNNTSDTPEEHTQKLVSGGLGLSGSLASLAGAAFMAPATMPVAGGLFLLGGLLILAQTVYDYRDDLHSGLRGWWKK